MNRLNQTESLIFVILCVLCFQRQSFFDFYFNSTSRYLEDLLNIDNIYFDQMEDRIYTTELQLNSQFFRYRGIFLDLNLCISNGTVSIKIYDTRDDFDFDIVYFLCLDGDVP